MVLGTIVTRRALMFNVVRRYSQTASKTSDVFFTYTSSRWLYNEKQQLEARFLRFDWQALKRIASQAVGAECVDMTKHAEGDDSKIFLMSFDNGFELMAKIPTRLAGHPHLSTSSEVATMDYARTILNLPVPKVISWCSRADQTEVGAEYILMEVAPGKELEESWGRPGRRTWAPVLKYLAKMQKDVGSRPFSQIGNIYYAEDVAPHLRERPLYAPGTAHVPGSERFRLGPLVNRNVFTAGRTLPEADLGPFPNAASYLSSLIRIEQRWLRNHAVPRAPDDPFVIHPEDNDPSSHIRILDEYLKLIPALLPPLPLQAPVLWHTDLNRCNIFVSADEPPVVSSVIDWRDVSVLPYFLQASAAVPSFLDQPVDDRILIGGPLEVSRPPEGMEFLPEADQAAIRFGIYLTNLKKLFERHFCMDNESYTALQDIPIMSEVQDAFYLLNRTWFYCLRWLRTPLMEFHQHWEEYAPGAPWPATPISGEEILQYVDSETVHKQWVYSVLVLKLEQELGLGVRAEGRVPAEVYEEVKRHCDAIRADWDSSVFPFPFQDGAPGNTFVTLPRCSDSQRLEALEKLARGDGGVA
ncbi:hypothetical protein DFH06DRAFT_204206 [Mycena polygramma]|nr:hypothetical protein DFH06DRAFT_204206 [Mycena polygramma]